MAFCFKPLNCKSVNRNLANYFKAKKHFIKYFIMNHSGNDRCPFLLQWDTNHMSQDLLMLMSLLISTLSCSFPVWLWKERETEGEIQKKILLDYGLTHWDQLEIISLCYCVFFCCIWINYPTNAELKFPLSKLWYA